MNIKIFLVWLLSFVAENNYFGWNALPKSDAEMICDVIGLLILAMSFIRSEKIGAIIDLKINCEQP